MFPAEAQATLSISIETWAQAERPNFDSSQKRSELPEAIWVMDFVGRALQRAESSERVKEELCIGATMLMSEALMMRRGSGNS